MLYELAVKSGAKFLFNSEVVSIDPCRPSVTLKSGKVFVADIILGADGGGSIVRKYISNGVDRSKIGPYTGYL